MSTSKTSGVIFVVAIVAILFMWKTILWLAAIIGVCACAWAILSLLKKNKEPLK